MVVVVMIKMFITLVLVIWFFAAVYGAVKPLPQGVSFEGKEHRVPDVEFVYDLTYVKKGELVHEMSIFKRKLELIGAAREFIVVDMFLFNNEYDRKYSFPQLSAQLKTALIEKKKQQPEIKILFITDEINTFYGSYKEKGLEELARHGIDVVLTDMKALRDSNPFYSGLWRLFLQWFDTGGTGTRPHPFSPDGPKVTALSYLKLLNFKANHRKVIVTEQAALITSANPHDASAYHSNIAFVVKGGVIGDFLRAERAVAVFSGGAPSFPEAPVMEKGSGKTTVRLLTEGKIKSHLLAAFAQCKNGDAVYMAMFYLADRGVVEALLAAAGRGVTIKLVLDANKDAFGREKRGIPNRPVALELMEKSGGDIQVRWYDTHGEQFHTKLVVVRYKDRSEVFGGSANLTRRNIMDFNLEADIKISAPNEAAVTRAVMEYFERIWENRGGTYTVDFDAYADGSLLKTIEYRFQELSGMSTF